MGVEAFNSSEVNNIMIMEEGYSHEEPLNGTDARRRLEDKIEELRLQRELKEFDFDE